jgi:hypothetical protein
MTCLTVSRSIHPISAPTGTDADIGGNDKRTPSLDFKWERTGGVERNFLLRPGQIDRYWPFMTSPGPECTCRELEKRQDNARRGPTAIGDGSDPAPPVGLPAEPYLQSAARQISSANKKIIVAF